MSLHCVTLTTILFFVALPLSLQQVSPRVSPQCFSATIQFMAENSNDIPAFCQRIVERFNDPQYRVDFTQEEVADICLIDLCFPLLQLEPYCKTFAKKDLNCLDSPAMIALLCATSNTNVSCYNSLVSQGVVGYPQLLKPCLDALYNAESCSDECRNLLMNADCCFVSYYSFMIDAFVNSDGMAVFNVGTVNQSIWNWCALPSPGVCPGVDLTDVSTRNNDTCEPNVTEPPTANMTVSNMTNITVSNMINASMPNMTTDGNGGAAMIASMSGIYVITLSMLLILVTNKL